MHVEYGCQSGRRLKRASWSAVARALSAKVLAFYLLVATPEGCRYRCRCCSARRVTFV